MSKFAFVQYLVPSGTKKKNTLVPLDKWWIILKNVSCVQTDSRNLLLFGRILDCFYDPVGIFSNLNGDFYQSTAFSQAISGWYGPSLKLPNYSSGTYITYTTSTTRTNNPNTNTISTTDNTNSAARTPYVCDSDESTYITNWNSYSVAPEGIYIVGSQKVLNALLQKARAAQFHEELFIPIKKDFVCLSGKAFGWNICDSLKELLSDDNNAISLFDKV